MEWAEAGKNVRPHGMLQLVSGVLLGPHRIIGEVDGVEFGADTRQRDANDQQRCISATPLVQLVARVLHMTCTLNWF